MTTPKAPSSDLQRFELLALRLGVHGLHPEDRGLVRAVANGPHWLELRTLLREHGFSEAEIAELAGRHPSGCPCWTCVLGLNRWVKRTSKKQ